MNLDIYKITIMVTDIIGIIICYYFFGGFLERKQMHLRVHLSLLIALCLGLMISNLYFQQAWLLLMIATITYTVMVLVFFNGQTWIRVLSGLFITILGAITELMTALFLSVVSQVGITESSGNISGFMLGAFISKLLLIILMRLILRRITPKKSIVSSSYWRIMLTIPVVSVFMILQLLNENLTEIRSGYFALVTATGILYINLVSFGLFERVIQKIEENNYISLSNQNLQMQRSYYEQVLINQNSIRSLWHDMKNHFLSIHAFLNVGDTKGANGYLEGVNKMLLDSISTTLSGNPIIDSIVGTKIALAEQNNIAVIREIYSMKDVNIDPIDLSIILGNALDNAIESCDKVVDGAKEIVIKMKYDGDIIMIFISNTLDPGTINYKKGKYISSNDPSRGFGIENMEKAVIKYKGNMKIDVDGIRFILKILLPV